MDGGRIAVVGANSAVGVALLAQVAGGDALDRLHEYADAGCERFMLQYTDYDDLAPLERWADACLPRLHPRDPGSRPR